MVALTALEIAMITSGDHALVRIFVGLAGLLYVSPLLYLATVSISGVSGDGDLSAAAFVALARDSAFLSSLALSATIAAAIVALQLSLATAAGLLTRATTPSSLLLRAVLGATYFVPTTALHTAWLNATDPAVGPLALLLRRCGVLVDFRAEAMAPLATIVIGFAEGFGFVYLVVTVRLLQLPRAVRETCSMASASHLPMLRHVVWPHLAPVLVSLAALRTVITFAKFDAPWLAYARLRPSAYADTMSVWVHRNQFEYARPGVAAAGALVVTALLACVLFGAARASERPT